AVFLGARLNVVQNKDIKEVRISMWLPCLILAAICLILGVFAFAAPLKYFIFSPFNLWSPLVAALLLLCGLFFGFIIFKLDGLKPALRRDAAFIGGEKEPAAENMFTGTEFYNTVEDIGFLRRIYKKAAAGTFDVYEQGKKLSIISKPLQFLHNGVLPTYLVWMLLGMIGLFFFLAK
ncbi:MAG: hypothetical protein MUC39_06265, partial [Candidatus Omnitrophica bacterium]|nr:hypothetical protein [Candidatus Omnitrophota bacterium]